VCCALLLLHHSAELRLANSKQWQKHIMRCIDMKILPFYCYIFHLSHFFKLNHVILYFFSLICASPSTNQNFVIFKNEEDEGDDDL
jgi:hypothetical protein